MVARFIREAENPDLGEQDCLGPLSGTLDTLFSSRCFRSCYLL